MNQKGPYPQGFLGNYSVKKPMCHSFYLIHVITRSHFPLAPGSPKIGATLQTKVTSFSSQKKFGFPLFLRKRKNFRSLDIMNYRKKKIFGFIDTLNYHSRKRDIVSMDVRKRD